MFNIIYLKQILNKYICQDQPRHG